MTDSSSFSSLFALIDSHLSKTSLQDNGGDSNTTSLNIPPSSISESLLPVHTRPRLPIPRLGPSESPIQSVLARQVANMLIAKERKQQEDEKRKLEEEMMRLKIEEEKNSMIDLTKAIQTPYYPKPCVNEQSTLSSSNSVESLLKLNFTACDSDSEERTKTPEPELPCIRDMSYMLKKKVRMGKCSAFGKVLTSRLKPVPAFYLKEKIPTSIVPFDFSTPSPCEIIRESRKYRPTMSTTFTLDITKFV